MLKFLFRQKLNPSQYQIAQTESSSEPTHSYTSMYEQLEIVNRAVNMLVDDCSDIDYITGDMVRGFTPAIPQRKSKDRVSVLLNLAPNKFQDVSTFRRNLFLDYLLDGNVFIYYDGADLYHLPANKVTIVGDKKTHIEKYTMGSVDYYPSEIIHIKENSFDSIYRGTSRLSPALRTMILIRNMRQFQDNFFKNGALPGIAIKSPDTLSDKIKRRMKISWQQEFRPNTGGQSPVILDGGMSLETIGNGKFQELDFQNGIENAEKIVLKAIGIPPILLDSGNNANIKPNMRLYYLETVLPIIRKFNKAFTRFFGYEVYEDMADLPALQPELSDLANFHVSLVNGGIETPNEGRIGVNLQAMDDESMDQIRVPANIAGSASNPSVGGRPSSGDE